MKKPILIIASSILALGVVGGGALLATENWLGQRLETELESELTESTGIEAAVGQTEVQLLQRRVMFHDLAFANVPGFSGENLLVIRHIELQNPQLQGKPLQVAIANLEGVTVNIEGDLNDLPDPRLVGALPNVNIAQLIEQLEPQIQASSTADGQPTTTFTVDQLAVQNIQVNLNLTVPWQEQAIARQITVPDVSLTGVTNLNLGDKLGESLGAALTEELSLFFFEEILPGSFQYAQESLPGNLDLSGFELPDTIEIPSPQRP
ncbi:hypothetical protein FEK30_15650 [Picosynechococcus sp. PCC 11901]|uniref:hypothetical protein n=1 Tax=Picosynechococcus sp. PCC 11901 TaxID=2579791 RepID=UPI0010FC25DC|nr:hypothetical protein [Picosynechococcus sp. PCC 11901]QCS50741.1 hypothetical protein FEK30_15650 [Picosynechococcus sp. PCC 11901]